MTLARYAPVSRAVKPPRPACPVCMVAMWFDGCYRRKVRQAGVVHELVVHRVRCPRCRAGHAVLPDFVVARRLDTAEVIGAAVAAVLLLVAATALGIWWTARKDARPSSDAIVVLGSAQYNGVPSSIFEARLEHALDLYEDGVSGRLNLDYGDFAINGTMSRLDLAKADAKSGADCKK